MSYPCPVSGCDRNATEWLVCRSCAARLERDLGDVPGLAAQVSITLARQGANTLGGAVAGTDPPLVFDQRASAALSAVKAVLVAWVRDAEDTHPEPWPADTEAGCARWLLARIAVLRMHPAAGDLCTEVHTVVTRCRRVIDNPAERTFAGPCRDCGLPMYAERGALVVVCRTAGCHAVADVADCRAHLIDSISDQLLSIPEMCHLLPAWLGVPLTDSTLRSWRHRGRLVHHGLTLSGKETFRVGDVLDLLAATEARSA